MLKNILKIINDYKKKKRLYKKYSIYFEMRRTVRKNLNCSYKLTDEEIKNLLINKEIKDDRVLKHFNLIFILMREEFLYGENIVLSEERVNFVIECANILEMDEDDNYFLKYAIPYAIGEITAEDFED